MDGYTYFGIALIVLSLMGIGMCEEGDSTLAVVMFLVGVWMVKG